MTDQFKRDVTNHLFLQAEISEFTDTEKLRCKLGELVSETIDYMNCHRSEIYDDDDCVCDDQYKVLLAKISQTIYHHSASSLPIQEFIELVEQRRFLDYFVAVMMSLRLRQEAPLGLRAPLRTPAQQFSFRETTQ